MTQGLRLLFDDCLSAIAAKSITSPTTFAEGQVEIAHLVDLGLKGEIDDVWIPRIASEGWIVITADRGKRPSRGGKLPHLCMVHSVTHVLMSASLMKRKTFEKIRAIIAIWPELAKTPSAPRGSRFLLQLTGPGHPILIPPKERIVEVAPTDPETGDRTLFE